MNHGWGLQYSTRITKQLNILNPQCLVPRWAYTLLQYIGATTITVEVCIHTQRYMYACLCMHVYLCVCLHVNIHVQLQMWLYVLMYSCAYLNLPQLRVNEPITFPMPSFRCHKVFLVQLAFSTSIRKFGHSNPLVPHLPKMQA